MRTCAALLGLVAAVPPAATAAEKTAKGNPLWAEIDRSTATVLPRVVAWRRDFHQHPELGNREVRTSGIVAEHLRGLGLEVRTGVAKTGVVGVLRGGRPGPTVALRADMDGLPVTEEVDLPFRSTARAEWMGGQVGVMHACGHDNHVAILMGVAEVLSGLRARLPGAVKFLFQPAEEGPPPGERGGAEVMIDEGALAEPPVEAIFGLHVFPFEVGTIRYRPAGLMAAGDTLRITVRGRQTHGALPWAGVDPIVAAAQIVLGLQTVVSRQSELTAGPAIVTIGLIQGGNRRNIIPDEVRMEGTIRTFDEDMRREIHARVRRTAEQIAQASGATAQVEIETGNRVTWNDPALAERMGPTLKRVAGEGRVDPAGRPTTTSEDFADYQAKVPGLFFFLGVTPKGADPAGVAPNHSPRFFADEAALPLGVRALAHLAVDFLTGPR
jgi:amidohydrolase